MDSRHRRDNRNDRPLSIQMCGLLTVLVSLCLWLLVDSILSLAASMESVKPNEDYKNSALDGAYPNGDFRHVWWLVQISDIHISSYRNDHIPNNMKLFLSEVLPAVSPMMVLATGDLTDAKMANGVESAQELAEWQKYRKLLDKYLLSLTNDDGTIEIARRTYNISLGSADKVPWIDMRGNHDNFDVASPFASDDLFSQFSPTSHYWKITNKRHLLHKFDVDNVKYAIVATDATVNPGFRRPYNFFGVLSEETLSDLSNTDKELSQDGVQMSIWAGHYPTAIMFVGGTFSSQKRLLDGSVIRHGAVYLCGHLHTLHDVETEMYARHPPLGQLELELGDFQRAERFRILAVDHGLLSFTDVRLRSWPVVLVTNPKNALYAMPNFEPLDKIAKSSHIRILAFSTSTIAFVQVTVDGNVLGNATKVDNHPLYTLPWQPYSIFSANKFHNLEVKVVDAEKRMRIEKISFIIDKTAADQLPDNIGGPLASLILRTNIPRVLRNMFIASTLVCMVALLIARYSPYILCCISPFKKLNRGLINFSMLPLPTFVLFLFIVVYPVIGPWFLGEILTGRYGLVFGHGVLLFGDGTFVPEAVVTFVGICNVITFFMPLMLYFSWLCSTLPILRRKITRISQRLVFQLLILWQLFAAYYDALAYGKVAFFINPIHTWTSLAVIYIDFQARKSVNFST